MRQMKDSGIPWIDHIPVSWSVDKIKYNLHREEPRNPGNVPVLSLYRDYGVVPKDSRDDNHNVTSEDTSKYKYVRRGDFVINKMKAWQGSVAVSGYEGIVSPAYFVYRFDNQKLLRRYFHYLLRSCYKDEFRRLSGGIREGQWDLPSEALDNTLILLPPVVEQQRISDFLDEKCAEIDALTADIQKEIEMMQEYRRSLITEAVTKGLDPDVKMKESGVDWLGEIPETWDLTRIKYCLSERKEHSVDGSEMPLSMSQKKGIIPTSEMDLIPNMAESLIGSKIAHVDDLVFNKLKAHLGVFSVSKYFGLVSPDYAVYYAKNYSTARFFEYLFKTKKYINEFKKRSMGVGAGLTRLYTSDLFPIHCALPKKEEIISIVTFLDDKCAVIDCILETKQKQLDTLAEYRKSLIYEYVTGKKEVV